MLLLHLGHEAAALLVLAPATCTHPFLNALLHRHLS
jgi:hypothetical protein